MGLHSSGGAEAISGRTMTTEIIEPDAKEVLAETIVDRLLVLVS